MPKEEKIVLSRRQKLIAKAVDELLKAKYYSAVEDKRAREACLSRIEQFIVISVKMVHECGVLAVMEELDETTNELEELLEQPPLAQRHFIPSVMERDIRQVCRDLGRSNKVFQEAEVYSRIHEPLLIYSACLALVHTDPEAYDDVFRTAYTLDLEISQTKYNEEEKERLNFYFSGERGDFALPLIAHEDLDYLYKIDDWVMSYSPSEEDYVLDVASCRLEQMGMKCASDFCWGMANYLIEFADQYSNLTLLHPAIAAARTGEKEFFQYINSRFPLSRVTPEMHKMAVETISKDHLTEGLIFLSHMEQRTPELVAEKVYDGTIGEYLNKWSSSPFFDQYMSSLDWHKQILFSPYNGNEELYEECEGEARDIFLPRAVNFSQKNSDEKCEDYMAEHDQYMSDIMYSTDAFYRDDYPYHNDNNAPICYAADYGK